ncbi:Vitamin B12 import ATP-binding protein BtuD [Candidatus Magnetaquicoccaceae bacterium FCR-1]|uniref:Vitamin B12 import ATP-binding protein BtuD n=1 Tax=Candidatus Magnetaquiglobus chichijimensis TaxID=3141448 RepID=A0ABQ0CBH7_9PROT
MIEVQDLTITYHRHPAVHHLTGRFAAGELTAVTGPNGAGKTTLFKALMGEIPLAGGSIDWHGLAREQIAWLPQSSRLDRTFPMSVADTVLMGAWRQSGALGRVTRELAERARRSLELVRLSGFEGRGIDALSAGQFQRVLFARLMMLDARVILLDEPFAALDARSTEELLELLHRWQREGRTVIAILHDLEQIRAHFPHTLLLARHRIAWGDTETVLTAGNVPWNSRREVHGPGGEGGLPPSGTLPWNSRREVHGPGGEGGLPPSGTLPWNSRREVHGPGGEGGLPPSGTLHQARTMAEAWNERAEPCASGTDRSGSGHDAA